MSDALLIANGEPPSKNLFFQLISQHTKLIAVDGGLFTFLQYGIEPHLLIGDFDSVSSDILLRNQHIPQVHTPDQNHSDLEKAFFFLFEQGVQTITVCAALGRRLDHTLTNICLLSRYPGKIKFETDTETCFALEKSSVLQCQKGQIISLLPVSSNVYGVTTRGLKWELNKAILNKFYLSISNVCLTNHVAIDFKKGNLIACLGRQNH